MIKKITIETPIGEMVAGATKEGLCLLEFGDRKSLQSQIDEVAGLLETTFENGSNKNLRMVKKQLKEYFKGKRKEFTIPLLTPGSDFQQSVWKDLVKIPYGSTKTYQEQADLLNNPGSVRAVAHANASNRIAIMIPCHRVIGSDGHLIGYGGGLERKRWLLDHERKFSGKPVDLNLFQ
jgi:AraC family transcriptional regulator, regulatory protein of adaptative response / methylated-DNA-[protein]-cysteine methyltransferase